MSAVNIIKQLGLQPHPEGGYYAETYRSAEQLTTADGRVRSVSTAIYFLLQGNDKSHLHHIKSDELWLFHQGAVLEILVIENGELRTILLGNDGEKGELPQAVVPSGAWFGARVKDGKGYALVSCIVSPGFDFVDFEMGQREVLVREFPKWRGVIEELTED